MNAVPVSVALVAGGLAVVNPCGFPLLPAFLAWDSNVLNDPRVIEFWDGDRIAGKWFADKQLGGLGGPGSIVWDAYYAFPSGSTWTSQPGGMLAAGSDIIDNVSRLENNFVPLLRR
jgi:hypothetical protein